jgi:natural product precursor
MTIKETLFILIINTIIMKKIKLTKGLQINKEAVSKLQESQMKDVKGGRNEAGISCKNTTGASCTSQTATQSAE